MGNGPKRLSNRQLAEKFRQIADLLEIKGEVIYKILAYRRAAESLDELGRDAYTIWEEDKLTNIPGVGKAIAEKIEELFTTGKLDFLERLTKEVPASLVELLAVPDLGPKKVARFWRELGITNLDELEAAAQAGKLRELSGMGARSEAKILEGIEALARRTKRIPLGRAWPFARELMDMLRAVPGVKAIATAGSLRRGRATVGDLDLVVASLQPEKVMEAFVHHREVGRILGHGETKSSVEFERGIRAQLWAYPPERFGTGLQYATGSQAHNVRLRELALKQGYSLSEHALTRNDGHEVLCATEEEVYAALGLPYIPPELREDRGEIQAAQAGELPELLDQAEIQAELHTHSTWSDGRLSIREMAEAARARGMRVIAITDHSGSLGVAGGLSLEDVRAQRAEIAAVQAELGDSICILQGSEVEIRADGSLDYPDEVLAEMDIVIAALHSSLRQPRAKITRRLLNAMSNPHVDMIAHPTGRMIPDREGADLDMDAILQAAAKYGVALEINAYPARLDLDDIYARRAVEIGVLLSINTDAHTESDLDLLHFGVTTARRGWVCAQDVINAWEPERLIPWLKARGTEV